MDGQELAFKVKETLFKRVEPRQELALLTGDGFARVFLQTNFFARPSEFLKPLSRARDRKPFLVKQAFNQLENFKVFWLVDSMARRRMSRTQERKLGFPEAQHVGWHADYLSRLADL